MGALEIVALRRDHKRQLLACAHDKRVVTASPSTIEDPVPYYEGVTVRVYRGENIIPARTFQREKISSILLNKESEN